jgi:hypothetical protein
MYWQWQPITAIVWKAGHKTLAMILTEYFSFAASCGTSLHICDQSF